MRLAAVVVPASLLLPDEPCLTDAQTPETQRTPNSRKVETVVEINFINLSCERELYAVTRMFHLDGEGCVGGIPWRHARYRRRSRFLTLPP